jgi:hypothetical protein
MDLFELEKSAIVAVADWTTGKVDFFVFDTRKSPAFSKDEIVAKTAGFSIIADDTANTTARKFAARIAKESTHVPADANIGIIINNISAAQKIEAAAVFEALKNPAKSHMATAGHFVHTVYRDEKPDAAKVLHFLEEMEKESKVAKGASRALAAVAA